MYSISLRSSWRYSHPKEANLMSVIRRSRWAIRSLDDDERSNRYGVATISSLQRRGPVEWMAAKPLYVLLTDSSHMKIGEYTSQRIKTSFVQQNELHWQSVMREAYLNLQRYFLGSGGKHLARLVFKELIWRHNTSGFYVEVLSTQHQMSQIMSTTGTRNPVHLMICILWSCTLSDGCKSLDRLRNHVFRNVCQLFSICSPDG